MAGANFVTIEEYLAGSYEYDRDYVEGVLEERNGGEMSHSHLMALLIAFFYDRRERFNFRVLPSVRVHISTSRVRVCDVALVPCGEQGPILRNPPLLCVEVLSPADRLDTMRARTSDYHTMGVPGVWIVNADPRIGYQSTQAGEFYQPAEGILTALDGALTLNLEELV